MSDLMNILSINRFAEEILNLLETVEHFNTGSCSITRVNKGNHTTLLGIMYHAEDSNVAPTTYLEDLYEDYKSGRRTVEKIAHLIGCQFRAEDGCKIDIEWIKNYMECESKMRIAICDTDSNEEIRYNCPTWQIAKGLTAYIRITLTPDDWDKGYGSIKVTNQILEKWGVDFDIVKADAEANMNRLAGLELIPMESILNSLMGIKEDSPEAPEDHEEFYITDTSKSMLPMFVATCRNKVYGAGAIADRGFMHAIAEEIGEGFYILPSSQHEVIILKNDDNFDAECVVQMIQEVNETNVDPKDILSYNLYRYFTDAGVVLVKEGRPV